MKIAFAWVMTGLIAASLSAVGQVPDSITQWAVTASGYPFHPNIVYERASGQDLKLDVTTIEPLTQPRPTVLLIHGGGWIQGTKDDFNMASLPFLAKGMNTVNVDYRLGADALAPAAVEDCRCALRWMYRNAKKYGFDTSKIVVAGESAGGHLALTTGLLQASAGFDNRCAPEEGEPPLKVAAIISYSGPTDVLDLVQGPHRLSYALRWFGSVPNPSELARRLSPVDMVRPGLPPIILTHGDTDPYVPYQEALRLHQELDRAGDPNTLITVHSPIHGWAMEREWSIQQQVFQLLEKYGVLGR